MERNKPLALQVADSLAQHVTHNSPEAKLIDDLRREHINGVTALDLLERVCEAAAHLHRAHDLDCTASFLSALCNIQGEWSGNLENAIDDELRERRQMANARFGRAA